MNSINTATKPRTPLGRPPLQSGRLLDQVRERIPYLHNSLGTEPVLHFFPPVPHCIPTSHPLACGISNPFCPQVPSIPELIRSPA